MSDINRASSLYKVGMSGGPLPCDPMKYRILEDLPPLFQILPRFEYHHFLIE